MADKQYAYAMEDRATMPSASVDNRENAEKQGKRSLRRMGYSLRKNFVRIAIVLFAMIIVALLAVLITQQLNTQRQAQLAYDLASGNQGGENKAQVANDVASGKQVGNQQAQQTGDVSGSKQDGANAGLPAGASPLLQGTRDDKLLQDCLTGSLKQTFPDIDYSFYGYNILQGYPLADGRDPGFTRPIFAFDFSPGSHTADCRYMIPHGLTAAPDVSCTTSFTSKLVENSNDLQSSLEAHAKVSGGGWGVSFSASASYKENSAEVSTGKTKVTQSSANCKYYFTKIAKLDMPDYSPELMKWMGRLNQSMTLNGIINDNDIFDFLNYFGTHFPSEVVYGARYTYESRISEGSFRSLSARGVSVEVQASYSGFFSVGGGAGMSSSQKAEAQNFQSKTTTRTTSVGAPPPYDGDAMTWASTVKESPVPVQYNLVPIYDLFSPEYTTRPYFTESIRRQIRDKMVSYVSSYCRQMSDSGIDAVCNDASVIKFEGVEMITKYATLNKNLVDCIEECMRDGRCSILANWPSRSSSSCYLAVYNAEQTIRRCSGCYTYAVPQAMTARMTLKSFRYDNSVPRRNKLNIRGTSDYGFIANFCAISCSIDSSCLGFEVSNRNNYNYNCATYSTHTTKLVPTDRYNFETQLMSDLAKRNSLNDLRHKSWSSFVQKNAKLATSQNVDFEKKSCDHSCCKDLCGSNLNCLAGIYVSPQGSCKLILDSMDAKLTLVSGSSRDYVRVYTYRERPISGWFNISGIHVGGSSSLTSGLSSANACATLCSSNAMCRLASWDASQSACNIHDSVSWRMSNSSTRSISADSKLMFPNYRQKIANFKLYI